ncbi:MAG: 30S ribosomal protein S8e [Candidatus Diapherotrites archaeon]
MVEWKHKSKRRKTGGVRNSVNARDKRLYEKGGKFSATKIGKEDKRETQRGLGGTVKTKIFHAKYANVLDQSSKKSTKAEIVTVKKNDANREYARGNIITKGAEIEVKIGTETRKARVSSRPGQDGSINAVLLAK